MKKILFLILIFLPISSSNVFAADLNVVCPESPSACTKSGTDPLFSQSLDGLWYPGKSVTRTINLKNSSATSKQMAIAPLRTSPESDFENVLMVNIPTIYSGSLKNFYSQPKIIMGNFAPNEQKDFNFRVTMNQSAGNDYQNKETVFDLTLGFWEESPPPTPTPANTSGNAISIVTITNIINQLNSITINGNVGGSNTFSSNIAIIINKIKIIFNIK